MSNREKDESTGIILTFRLLERRRLQVYDDLGVILISDVLDGVLQRVPVAVDQHAGDGIEVVLGRRSGGGDGGRDRRRVLLVLLQDRRRRADLVLESKRG